MSLIRPKGMHCRWTCGLDLLEVGTRQTIGKEREYSTGYRFGIDAWIAMNALMNTGEKRFAAHLTSRSSAGVPALKVEAP